MKAKIRILVVLFAISSSAYCQSVNMRVSTYFYSWERADSINSDLKTSHIRGYQNLLLEFSGKNWSFNTLAQTEEDVTNRINGGFNYRFYNLYLMGSNLWNALDVRLGRQYTFAGVGKGPIDGLNLKLKAGKNKEYQLTGYGGALVPYNYDFRNYPEIGDNYMWGGIFSYYGVRGMSASLSYTNKHRKPEPYTAIRLDSLMHTTEVLIDIDSPADQLIGVDLNYSYLQKHRFFGKAYYDLNNKKFYRAELNASLGLVDNLQFNVFYDYRQPQISYNTIFRVFQQSQYHESGASFDYMLKNGINISAGFSNVIYEDDNSWKIRVGVANPSFSLSYVKYTGYAGESDGAYGYYAHQIVDSKLSGNVSVNYSRYNVGDYSTGRQDAFAGMLGLTYRPVNQVSIDAQGQIITNPIYKYDTRFLLGINYWLFSKF